MTTQEEIQTGKNLIEDIDSDFQTAKKMNAQYREHQLQMVSESLREIRILLGME